MNGMRMRLCHLVMDGAETKKCSALILQYISHARIQPAHVQCFILMASYLCSVNCLPQAWILVGQALRTGQDVGLHVGH